MARGPGEGGRRTIDRGEVEVLGLPALCSLTGTTTAFAHVFAELADMPLKGPRQ
jgi:hypothetical protein